MFSKRSKTTVWSKKNNDVEQNEHSIKSSKTSKIVGQERRVEQHAEQEEQSNIFK